MKNAFRFMILLSALAALAVVSISCNLQEELNNDPMSLEGMALAAEKTLNQVWPDGARQVTDYGSFDAEFPAVAWTGLLYDTRYGIVTQKDQNIYLLGEDANGIRMWYNTIAATTAQEIHPSISFGGGRFGISFSSSTGIDIYFMCVNNTGSDAFNPIVISDDDMYAHDNSTIAWDSYHSNFGIAYDARPSCNSESLIYLRKVTNGGIEIGDPIRISQDNNCSYYPSVTWNNSTYNYALAWQEEDVTNRSDLDLTFALMDSNNNVTRTIIDSNNNYNTKYPSLVWHPREKVYGVSYLKSNAAGWDVCFALLNSGGVWTDKVAITVDHSVNEQSKPSIAVYYGASALPPRYVIVWEGNDIAHPGSSETYWAHIKADGTVWYMGPISSSDGTTKHPNISSSIDTLSMVNQIGGGFVWSDSRDGNFDIFFRNVP